jgi:hypothetical protein
LRSPRILKRIKAFKGGINTPWLSTFHRSATEQTQWP